MRQIIVASMILVSILVAVFVGQSKEKPIEAQRHEAKTTIERPSLSAVETASLVNRERLNHGLSPLAAEPLLDQSAADKCQDMVTFDYWSHNTPSGKEPWVFITPYIPTYNMLGENLADGYKYSDAVVRGWMSSPSHKANILEAGYNRAGYAICETKSGSPLVVQHFAG